jgi:hypothetical protein
MTRDIAKSLARAKFGLDLNALPESTHGKTTRTPPVEIPERYLSTYRRAKLDPVKQLEAQLGFTLTHLHFTLEQARKVPSNVDAWDAVLAVAAVKSTERALEVARRQSVRGIIPRGW